MFLYNEIMRKQEMSEPVLHDVTFKHYIIPNRVCQYLFSKYRRNFSSYPQDSMQNRNLSTLFYMSTVHASFVLFPNILNLYERKSPSWCCWTCFTSITCFHNIFHFFWFSIPKPNSC